MSKNRSTNISMAALMLLIGLLNVRCAERLTVGNGLGWDGVNYAAWTQDFYGHVVVKKLPEYYLQRCLPSGVIHYATSALLAPFYSHTHIKKLLSDAQNVVRAFDIYHVILLTLAAYVWGCIGDRLRFSVRGKWFGFILLFINCAILKINFFAPVAIDVSAFLLGMLMFYFFIAAQPLGLVAVMLVSTFTWPTLPYFTAVLLAFPHCSVTSQTEHFEVHRNRRVANTLSLAICAIALLMFVYLFRQAVPQQWNGSMVRIDTALEYLSVLAVVIYLYFGVRAIMGDGRLISFKRSYAAADPKWAVIAVAILIASHIALRYLAKPVPWAWNFKEFLMYVAVSSLTEPFIFVVSHVVYYGPVILLVMCLWRPVCNVTTAHGLGLAIVLLLNVFLSICPQSRYQIPALPVVVAMVVQVVDRKWLRHWSLIPCLAVSLLFSKVWQTFNTSPMQTDGTMASLQLFPIQNLFMNVGPWMSHSMYVVQGAVVLVAGIVLWYIVRQQYAEISV